jgi:hypothetical protein
MQKAPWLSVAPRITITTCEKDNGTSRGADFTVFDDGGDLAPRV